MENKLTLVEKAQKVMLFKANIAKECKKRNLRMPSDLQISNYINQGYGMNLDDFMHDYTHFEGIFRKERKEPSPLEKELLEAVMSKMSIENLFDLLKTYLEEETKFSFDPVYDLTSKADRMFMIEHFQNKNWPDLYALGEVMRFVSVDEQGSLHQIDVKNSIENLWDMMFDRVMMHPELYGAAGKMLHAIMATKLGYVIDYDEENVEYKFTYKGEK